MPGPTLPQHPRPPRSPRPAVFLDRDDTLIANSTLPDAAFPTVRGDLYIPEHVHLLPGVLAACAHLTEAGFALIVVTNQGGVARGGARLTDVEVTNDRLRDLLRCGDRCLIDAAYIAPHHPGAAVDLFRGDHHWRKPGPGMLLAAADELDLDLAHSWLVGDAARDIAAGIEAGLPPEHCLRVGPDGDAADLAEAAELILASVRSPGSEAAPPASPGPPPTLTAVPATTVTLRAHGARPLANADVLRNVESAARAIAERTGVAIIDLGLDDQSVTATLATHRLAATAFMAELRRATNAWHAARADGPPLWPDPADA